MKARILGNARRDGKFKVSFSFEGGPNGFGGNDWGRTINKIMTPEAIKADMAKHPDSYSPSVMAYFKV